MSGRGNLLSLFHKKTEASEISSSSGEHAKDSGLDPEQSVSSGEYRRIARENIGKELLSTSENANISIGRGRAHLLQSFKCNYQELRNKPHQTISLESTGDFISHISTNSGLGTSDVSQIYGSSEINSQNHCTSRMEIYGKKGVPVNLSCNYIGLKTDPCKGVYLYEVRFNPAIDSIHSRIKYLNDHKTKFGGIKVFDGCTLYLPVLLDNELTTFVSKNTNNIDIEIRLLFKKKESLKNCVQLYNILFDRVMKTLNYVKFGRKQFDSSCPKVIPMARLEVWPGYVTAVDEYDGGLMLCCDVSHRLLSQRTILDILIEIYQRNKSHYQAKAKKMLIGSIVLTRYNNRTYRIDDICFSQNPQSKFETRLGSYSYLEYYKNHYNINIRDEKQPLLISLKQLRKIESLSTEDIRTCLIPELCYLTGLHDETRSDQKLMRSIATFTNVSPNQRVLALDKYFKNVMENDEAKQILNNWGLSLITKNDNIIGRNLEQEKIYFGKKCISPGETADFSKDAVINEMLEVIHLNEWILIYQKIDQRAAKTLVHNMDRCCEAFGMKIRKPKIVSLDKDRVDLYVDALRRNICMQTQIAVCICPSSRDDRYCAIKKVCCSELPVPSQVINSRTLSNEARNRSIVQKIILQMNCKMGGSLWTVKIPFKNVMICGIDSYHDPCQKSSSVAALVASLNSSYTHWYSKAVIQTKKEELVNGLTSSFENALKCYKKRNGNFPESVIIYRDGVGDGQLNLCTMYEIPQFEAMCTASIKITFIVVQKRNNTRFFSKNGSNFGNPIPGTVVDKHITKSKMYDFYLVSQMVKQGTVSPTHFVVLRDDANYGPDIIQKLSYKLCFLYFNWPGTIRIPACCMYAHKMAYLIGESVQRDSSRNLAEKLFYL